MHAKMMKLVVLLLCAAIVGCKGGNEVSEPRAQASGEQGVKTVEKAAAAAKVEQPSPAAPESRPSLAPGTPYAGASDLPSDAKKLDIAALISGQQANVAANSEEPLDLALLFDGNENTLVRSNNVNPLIITLTFPSPVKLRGVRVLSSASDYAWAVETDAGRRLTVEDAKEGQWSVMTWPEGISTSRLMVEVLRKFRDNFVHVREIEVYE